MKKQLIGFILPLLICVLTPLGAAAFNMILTRSPWPIAPGRSTTVTVWVSEDGTATQGQTVTFSVSPNDGTASLSPTSATTNSDGKVSTSLRLGSDATGSYMVTASVGTSSISTTVTVKTSLPLSIVVISSPRSGDPGDALTFTVEVSEDGTATQGQTVTFSVSPDNGTASLSPTSATTGSNGRASTTLTLGSDASGSYTVTATLGTQSVSGTATVETPPPPPPPELSIVVISSPGSGDPGDALTFTVEVREDGTATQGQTVTFSVSPNDGTASLSPTSATTGSNGQVSTTLTLGSDASGSYTVSASISGESVSGTATVETPPPPPEISIVVISSPGSGDPGDALTFTVEVREDGTATQGQTVTFSVSPNDGTASLSPTSATTGSDGRASTTLTLGSDASGSYTVSASISGESVSGTATVETPPPPPEISIVVISSPGAGDPGDALTFVVEVREDGTATQGQTVTFSVSPDDGTVSLSPTSATTGSNGRASTTLTLGSDTSGSYTVSASISGESVSGTATVGTSPPSGFFLFMTTSPWPGQPGGSFPFTLRVTDDGSPVEGQTVTFSVSPDDGTVSFSVTTATTDSDGKVSTSLRLGSDASGSYTVTALVGTSSISSTVTVDSSSDDGPDDGQSTRGTSQQPKSDGSSGNGNSTAVRQAISQTLTKVSGDEQRGPAGTALAAPFVVSVLDQNRSAFAGAVVTFSVTAGGGTLSSTTATTDANGRARSTLTLGSDPGTNTVTATVAGLEPVTFTASGYATPHSLTKVSGDGQEGPASTQLAAPFVVFALDENGAAIAGAVVTFSVTAGGGTLSSTTDASSCTIASFTSSTTATTDANGRASARLTLGSEPGSNTVSATVEGLEAETFTATATEQTTSHSLTKVCGDDQEGTAGVLLAEPFVVSVSDEEDAAMTGVVVTFSVTAGGGTLSSTTSTTDANGRAATRLTLGSELGTNSVEATVEGLVPVTFTAIGQESPFASLFDAFLSGSGKLVALPDSPQLAQNAPNPFNSQTVLSYFLPAAGPVRLDVFTLTGQRVAVLHQGPQQAGYHRLHWDGRDNTGRSLASGTYLYRLMTDETVLTRKLTLLR